MCLTIDKTKHSEKIPKPLIAEKDILVWKFLKTNNRSPYKRFSYKPDTTYKPIKLDPIYCYLNHRIVEGYHSWRTRDIARRKSNCFPERKIVKFYIPKGSKYFFGDNGDIVSSRIRSGDLKSQ